MRRLLGLLGSARSRSWVVILVASAGVGGACGGTNAADITGGDPPAEGTDAGLTDGGLTEEGGGSPDGSGSADSSAIDSGDGGSGDGAPDALCPDADGDGVTTCGGDCNDADATNFPGNGEICGDAKDNNCNAQADEGCGGLGTYVSIAKGNDANPGTQAQPVKTIAKGIAQAKAIGGTQTVFVAAGTYNESVDLSEGISLYGGYACALASCPWTRDTKVNLTTIQSQRPEGIVANQTITSATALDGFDVRGEDQGGGGTAESRGITCAGGTPTIRGNSITGGSVPAGAANRTSGIVVIAPSNDQATGVVIQRNVIQGALVTTGSSFGVLLVRPGATNPAVARIAKNQVRGGIVTTAGYSAGVVLSGSGANTVIVDNDIVAGSVTGTARTFGIRAQSPATIDKNRINADATRGSCAQGALAFCGGGIETGGTQLVITNNVVFGVNALGTSALLITNAEAAASTDIVVNGNYLDGSGTSVATPNSASAAIALRIAGGTNAVVGKIRNNILMGGRNESRYGVFEAHVLGKTCHPQAFDHNAVFFAPASVAGTDVVYHSDDGSAGSGADLTLAQLQASGTSIANPTPSGNLNQDCGATLDGHLNAGSACANAGTATEAPAKDMDGEARPKGAAIDIGADEVQ